MVLNGVGGAGRWCGRDSWTVWAEQVDGGAGEVDIVGGVGG